MIRVACPTCRVGFDVADHSAGEIQPCPKCNQRLRIPEPPAPPVPYDCAERRRITVWLAVLTGITMVAAECVWAFAPTRLSSAATVSMDRDDPSAHAAESTGLFAESGSDAGENKPAHVSGSYASSNKPVHVNGYYRSDGTYVQPHDRSAPGSKAPGGGGRRRR